MPIFNGISDCSTQLLFGLTLLLVLSPLSVQAEMAELTPPVQSDGPQQKTYIAAIDPRTAEAARLVEQGEQAIRQALSARPDGYQWKSAEQAKFFQSALRSFQAAYRLYRDRGDRRGEARALEKMGYAYSLLGDKEKQEESAQQRLRLYRELKDREGEAKTLEQLGSLYQSQRNNRKALGTYQQLLSLYRMMKNAKGEADTLHTLGWFYIALKDPSKADRYFQQSFRLEKQINGRVPIDRVNDVTNYFYEMEDDVRGIQYDRQLLSLYREMKNREAEMGILYNLGNAYYRSGNYGKALESLQQKLSYTQEKKDRETEAIILNQIGRVYYALGNNGKALEHYQQSLAITRTFGDRQLVLSMALTSDIGLALLKSGKLADAEQSLRESIQWHELVLQQLNNFQKAGGYAENPLKGWNGYQTLQRVLIAQKQVQAALEVSEQGRGRAYSELLLQRTQGKAPDEFQSIRIAEIQQVAREQNATLVEYAHIKEERSPTTSEEYLFIWVIQPTGQITFRQVDLSPLKQQNTSLDNLVMATRCLGIVTCETAIKSRGSQPIAFNVAQSDQQFNELPTPSTTNEHLQRLHQLLIAPIADLLPSNPNERVIFIPQGRLFLLPFAALQDSQGRYLLEKHTISFAPSIQVLQFIRQHRKSTLPDNSSNVLLVGNPTMPVINYAYALVPPAKL
ncbi:MAG: tetratricopeptide repeat protein, partial [Leptolyngbyaceae cyanobacterium bins.59]|nr:tetratricopeptide repeat protein [Leptolyngbyaceae cyanobacterium bins.59]